MASFVASALPVQALSVKVIAKLPGRSCIATKENWSGLVVLIPVKRIDPEPKMKNDCCTGVAAA